MTKILDLEIDDYYFRKNRCIYKKCIQV